MDYYGCPKPAYYVFKRCAKPLISSILPDDDGMCKVYLSANGNSPDSIHGVGRLYRYNILTGCEDNVHEFEVDTAYGESGVIYETPSISLDPETVLIFDIVTNHGSDRSFTLPAETNYAHMKFAENYGKIEIIRETDTEIEILAHEVTPFAMVDIPNTMLSENCMFMKRGERKIIYKEKLINV